MVERCTRSYSMQFVAQICVRNEVALEKHIPKSQNLSRKIKIHLSSCAMCEYLTGALSSVKTLLPCGKCGRLKIASLGGRCPSCFRRAGLTLITLAAHTVSCTRAGGGGRDSPTVFRRRPQANPYRLDCENNHLKISSAPSIEIPFSGGKNTLG